jgi:small subunit ribosomal protein S20
MANIKAAKKSIRTSASRRIENDRRRRVMRKVVKEINTHVAEGDAKAAMEKLPTAFKAIDKAVKKGVLKFNTASRTKSRLNARIKKTA